MKQLPEKSNAVRWMKWGMALLLWSIVTFVGFYIGFGIICGYSRYGHLFVQQTSCPVWLQQNPQIDIALKVLLGGLFAYGGFRDLKRRWPK